MISTDCRTALCTNSSPSASFDCVRASARITETMNDLSRLAELRHGTKERSMRRTRRLSAFFLLGLFTSPINPAMGQVDPLAFANPPAAARPHTWWHWMNGNITREGLTADL